MFHCLPLHQKRRQDAAADQALMSLERFGLCVGGTPLLKDLTFDIPKGDVLGLIGRAGAGKTVLMRTMCRLLNENRRVATSGVFRHAGQDIFDAACDLPTLRRQVAFVPQAANPFPLSIWDNIAYGARLNQLATEPDAMAQVVETALRRCLLWDDLRDVLHKTRGTELPIHQQRLLCVARSLATRPGMLLLDRPTGSIDRMELELLNRLVQDLKQDHTLVIVTATLAETAQVADRVAYLDEGRLVEIDSSEMIFTAALKQSTRDFINSTAM